MIVVLEEYKATLHQLEPQIEQLREALGMDRVLEQITELESRSSVPGFWDNSEESQKVLQQISRLKNTAEKYDRLKQLFEDAETMLEMAEEEDDEELANELGETMEQLQKELEAQTLATLLNCEYDRSNAILTFHAGAGGTEAQDWASMLYRMYTHWAEAHGFSYKILDYLDGDEAGLKSASILIEGTNAYGLLRSESGVHRLVRVSPFDASGRRHTSFSSLEVMPEIDDTIEVDIDPSDIKMDVFRSSGAGGQHINKTSSAVRLTHIPTGIVVACQTERSQLQNRETAMKMLKSKLFEIKEREHLEKISDIKGNQMQIAWGSQIRSYVFMPYTMVKDHRTGYETGNVQAVMDGDLDGFINAYLKAKSLGELKENG